MTGMDVKTLALNWFKAAEAGFVAARDELNERRELHRLMNSDAARDAVAQYVAKRESGSLPEPDHDGWIEKQMYMLNDQRK